MSLCVCPSVRVFVLVNQTGLWAPRAARQGLVEGANAAAPCGHELAGREATKSDRRNEVFEKIKRTE